MRGHCGPRRSRGVRVRGTMHRLGGNMKDGFSIFFLLDAKRGRRGLFRYPGQRFSAGRASRGWHKYLIIWCVCLVFYSQFDVSGINRRLDALHLVICHVL